MDDRLDLIIFGATGFTGRHTLPYVYKLLKTEKQNLTWGIAGRSEQKLKYILSETSKKIGIDDLSHIRIVIANVEDEESIRRMTAQAKIIVNCCGPYQLYGEAVVKACIETGTHHVDISGEPQFIEGMQLKYHKIAEEKGIYIVGSCGFDSVPSDLGTLFLEKHFKGTLNSVEIYVHLYEKEGYTSGPKIHYGTWASGINILENCWKLLLLRKKLYLKDLPVVQPKVSARFHKINNKWALPFSGTDCAVVKRTQRYFYDNGKKRPIQVQHYLLMDSFIHAISFIFCCFFYFLLSQFKFGKNLLLKYPEFFTNGLFSRQDIPEEVLKNSYFSLTLHGKGWKEKISEYKCKKPINKNIIGNVSAVNPGYGFTCLALILCAITILKQPKQLPPEGGVYTPAAAFAKTSLIEELQMYGTTFEIVSNEES